jgi:S-(hydroxymethyl)glutathione dehydrogenase / alcohol dehydrogenase
MAPRSSRHVSRRSLLKRGAAAAGGAAALLGGDAFARQPAQGGAPAIATGTQAGRRVRAVIKYQRELPTVEQITLRAIGPRSVVVRVEACQACYSQVTQALVAGNQTGLGLGQETPLTRATILGHGLVGVVEAVGPQVQTVEVGDRVITCQHAQCGLCTPCLHGRGDRCINNTVPPFADFNGLVVTGALGGGGFTEVTVVPEEYTVPVFTDISPAQLSNICCVGSCGFGMATTMAPVQHASDVVVLGAGVVGLHAIQGARIRGASQIIAVEPIRYRRELAMKLGATAVVDPNVEGDKLVAKLQDMCTNKKTARRFAGGGYVGPDHVIEAVGGDRMPPKVERGPDPTGVLPLQQGWDLCSITGTYVTCSIGQPWDAHVRFPAAQWADAPKHFIPGSQGGFAARKEIPRLIRLIESGQFNMQALAPKTFSLSETKQAFQEAADRTALVTAVLPTT